MNTFSEQLFNNELEDLVKLCEEAEDGGDYQYLYNQMSDLAVYGMFTESNQISFNCYIDYMQYINKEIENKINEKIMSTDITQNEI